MGKGTFGRVVECWDRETETYVAIKIIRAIQKYRDAAMIELDILKTLKKQDSAGQKPIIQLKSSFDWKNHVCMVFDRFGLSLYDFMKKNSYNPFHLDHLRDFAYQLLDAVSFLHDEVGLIHTDLKPENILLVHSGHTYGFDKKMYRLPTSTRITLIDFGSATFENQHHTSIISTRHYRAPEVILSLGWSYPCDLWSIGCILVEFFTGEALFQTHENSEHLKLMEVSLGLLPSSMINESLSQKYFEDGMVLWPGKARRSSIEHVKAQPQLKELFDSQSSTEALLFDLCKKLLCFDPKLRISAAQAKKHPFFNGNG
eukprot:TRINITY_DN3880_c0_g1_i1.p1 TRINITY_DN3880_c0_g1~~TRINITY_DN3880_c0_g1_i1.p1  ORF type:complete len:314 (+),score=41.40 TRINITY_DN3880_c0_g1_i1:219-1160(+)